MYCIQLLVGPCTPDTRHNPSMGQHSKFAKTDVWHMIWKQDSIPTICNSNFKIVDWTIWYWNMRPQFRSASLLKKRPSNPGIDALWVFK